MSIRYTRSKEKRYYTVQVLFLEICVSVLSSYLAYSNSLRQYTYEADGIHLSYIQLLTDLRLAQPALLQGLRNNNKGK